MSPQFVCYLLRGGGGAYHPKSRAHNEASSEHQRILLIELVRDGDHLRLVTSDLPSAQALTPGAPLPRASPPWLSALMVPPLPTLHPRVVTTLNIP